MPDREEKIRARAYALWERDGYAHGSHEQHWAEAERQIAAEEKQASSTRPTGAARSADTASAASNIETPAPPPPPKRRSGNGDAAKTAPRVRGRKPT